MARIAEELLLLLLDNASAQPGLDSKRRRRMLAAAVLLDLAHACRIRPSLPTEPFATGRLVLLVGSDPVDSVLAPALSLLARGPISPARAITKLSARVEGDLLDRLAANHEVQPIQLHRRGFKRPNAWPMQDRTRSAVVRAALLAALFEDQPPAPWTAASVALLHTVDALDDLLSLDQSARARVDDRAAEICSGSWIDENSGLADVNLAVTTAWVRAALT